MKKLTELDKENIIKEYNKGLNMTEVSKKLSLNKGTVYSFLKRKGIKIRKVLFYRFTEEEEKEVINFYLQDKENKVTTCKKFKCEHSTIGRILKKHGIKQKSLSNIKKIYSLNEDFFQIIDTEEKAYFLGLLYADGCNQINKGVITLALIEKDKNILEKFSKALNTDRPLRFLDRSVSTDGHKRQNQYLLSIGSRKLSNDLIKLGCDGVKTFTLKFPTQDQVPEHFTRHFIRGYFDGDGYCKSYMCKGSFKVGGSIVSTFDFCESIKNILMEKVGINCFLYINKLKKSGLNHNIRTLTISGTKQCYKFLDWIYKESSLFLERKYTIYIDLKNFLIERTINKTCFQNGIFKLYE